MYKILTHLHTQSPGIYRFLIIDGQEYATNSLNAAMDKAEEILEQIGYRDIRIVDDQEFDINVGPDSGDEPVETYKVIVDGPIELLNQPIEQDGILPGEEVTFPITFSRGVKVFHILINGKEQVQGIPQWIRYNSIDDMHGELIVSDIWNNLRITIVVDAWTGPDADITDVLTEEQIAAVNAMSVMLGDDLTLTYDNEILDIDFKIENANLIVESNVPGIGFYINNNKELEVTYNDGNNN